jgi:plastocyanin
VPSARGPPVDHGTDHGTGTKNGGPVVHLTAGPEPKFSPKEQRVNAGDTVTWKWDDNDFHSVVSDDGTWFSDVMGGGPPFSGVLQEI